MPEKMTAPRCNPFLFAGIALALAAGLAGAGLLPSGWAIGWAVLFGLVCLCLYYYSWRQSGRAGAGDAWQVLTQVMDTYPIGVMVLRDDGQVIFANSCAEEMLCVEKQEMTSRAYADPKWKVMHPDGTPFLPEELPFARVRETGEPCYRIQQTLEKTDGSQVHISVNASPLHLPVFDRPAVITVFEDITETVKEQDQILDLKSQLEEKIREDEARLAETSTLLEEVFSTTHFLLAYLDRDFRYVRINRAFAEFLGKPTGFFEGKNYFDFETRKRQQEIFQNVRDEGVPHSEYSAPWVSPFSKGARARYVDWTLLPVRGRDGKINALLLAAVDVTERLRTEQTLAKTEERVAQLEGELESLERLTRRPKTNVTAGLYGEKTFQAREPEMFQQATADYGHYLEQAMEERRYRVDHDLEQHLQGLADMMGEYYCGPRDVIELHKAVLTQKSRDASRKKQAAYAEEGRILVLELMGYLLAYYRRQTNYSNWRSSGDLRA